MTTKPDGPAYPPGVRLLASVTRLEVIDDTGRALTYPAGEPMEVELSFQDDDRTLKVFVRGRRHDYGPKTGKWQKLAGDNLPPKGDQQIEFWSNYARHGWWYARNGDSGWLIEDQGDALLSDSDLFHFTHWRIVEGPQR